MSRLSPDDTGELLPYIAKFSNLLSEFVPSALEHNTLLYSTEFVSAASSLNKAPQLVNEFEERWRKIPPTLIDLLSDLIDSFAEGKNADWQACRDHIISFYDAGKKKTTYRIAYSQNVTVPRRFRPLPSLYYSVQSDIQYFRQNYEDRSRAYRSILAEFQGFKSRFPRLKCPVPRKYAIVEKKATNERVWLVKKDAFRFIFQRTRELFQFHEEEAHFHHAARLLDYWQYDLERRFKPQTRNDKSAFEEQAKHMTLLTQSYLDVLERMQRGLEMEGIMKYVTDKMQLSREFITARNIASKSFHKKRYLLNENTHVLPPVINPEASLAVSLYVSLHERQILHDELKRSTSRLNKLLEQVQAWENLTKTKLFMPPRPEEEISPENSQEGAGNEVQIPEHEQEALASALQGSAVEAQRAHNEPRAPEQTTEDTEWRRFEAAMDSF